MRHLLAPIAGFTFLAVLLAVNIYASQMFDPLMFDVIKLDDVVVAEKFVSRIDESDLRNEQSHYFNSVFNDAFASEIYKQETIINNELQKYEELLNTNPKSRDVLVKLALLSLDKNDTNRAQEYYARAKVIDPWLEVEELENISSQ